MAKDTDKFLVEEIRCSAGKGIMITEQCLLCALTYENLCGYDYHTLKALYRQNHREGIHVSDLTGCLRKSWYDRNINSPSAPHEILAMALGSAVHEYVEGSDTVMQSELPLEAFGITGTTDVYYEAEKRLVDTKTTRWLTPSKLPYGSHELQINIYAAMLEASGKEVQRLFIQYIDMSGPTKCRTCKLPVEMDEWGGIACPKCKHPPKDAHLGAILLEVPKMTREEITSYIVERRDTLSNSLETGVPPEQEASWLCNYCKHSDVCLGEK